MWTDDSVSLWIEGLKAGDLNRLPPSGGRISTPASSCWPVANAATSHGAACRCEEDRGRLTGTVDDPPPWRRVELTVRHDSEWLRL